MDHDKKTAREVRARCVGMQATRPAYVVYSAVFYTYLPKIARCKSMCLCEHKLKERAPWLSVCKQQHTTAAIAFLANRRFSETM